MKHSGYIQILQSIYNISAVDKGGESKQEKTDWCVSVLSAGTLSPSSSWVRNKNTQNLQLKALSKQDPEG